eukprot:226456-Rhodomonas_salina.1
MRCLRTGHCVVCADRTLVEHTGPPPTTATSKSAHALSRQGWSRGGGCSCSERGERQARHLRDQRRRRTCGGPEAWRGERGVLGRERA